MRDIDSSRYHSKTSFRKWIIFSFDETDSMFSFDETDSASIVPFCLVCVFCFGVLGCELTIPVIYIICTW